jgi:1-deoxy-D-xylulose-5-phosphate reductoisomerase
MPRNLVVLGSTGSIGQQTLDVAREMKEHVKVYGLAAGRNAALLEQQAEEFRPAMVAISNVEVDESHFPHSKLCRGEQGLIEMAANPDVHLVVVGTTGRVGLLPTLAALQAGKLVALANKETLVMAGSLIRNELEQGHGELVPIDSEHSAIWQCLQGEPSTSVEKLTLTASGGALRDVPKSDLVGISPAQALRHPTWSMGPKITIDSANLMNKGLEAIEAQWLFDVPLERIEIVLHPQSIVHSLVTFEDGSTKAQLGLPNMRLPIQYALSHPDRWSNTLSRVDFAEVGTLSFESIEMGRYSALEVALEAGRQGKTYPAVLSASDEVAVGAFLDGSIRFTQIPEILEATLQIHRPGSGDNLEDILEADQWARSTADRLISG